MSRNDRQRVAHAARVAGRSDCKQTLGAVLVAGGRVLGAASNRSRNLNLVSDYVHSTIHAEEAVLRLVKNSAGATLYLARVSRSGTLLVARPCVRCHKQLVAAGVSRVVYTDLNGVLTSFRPSGDNCPEPRKGYEFDLVPAA